MQENCSFFLRVVEKEVYGTTSDRRNVINLTSVGVTDGLLCFFPNCNVIITPHTSLARRYRERWFVSTSIS